MYVEPGGKRESRVKALNTGCPNDVLFSHLTIATIALLQQWLYDSGLLKIVVSFSMYADMVDKLSLG